MTRPTGGRSGKNLALGHWVGISDRPQVDGPEPPALPFPVTRCFPISDAPWFTDSPGTPCQTAEKYSFNAPEERCNCAERKGRGLFIFRCDGVAFQKCAAISISRAGGFADSHP